MSRNFNENAGVLLEMEAENPQPAWTGVRAQTRAKANVLKGIAFALLITGIAVLGWLSYSLAAMRIYQVDECVNVWVAHLIATGKPSVGMEFFQVILSWVIPMGGRAADLFASARVIMFLIFWLNLILLAMATGERILSLRWLVALAGVATLAPLWDYGFEVRHDNLLLTGVLLMWGVVRFQPPRLGAFFFIGACFVGLEFISIKAILYTFPISLGILVFPPPGERHARWKLFADWCVGAVVSFIAMRLVFKFAGIGATLSLRRAISRIGSGRIVALLAVPDLTLPRLLTQTPLLVAIVIAAVIACIATVLRDRRAALNWDGILPEVLLFGAALTALFANPNPYPYNLLHVVPYAFLLAFRYGSTLWKQLPATFRICAHRVECGGVYALRAVCRRHAAALVHEQFPSGTIDDSHRGFNRPAEGHHFRRHRNGADAQRLRCPHLYSRANLDKPGQRVRAPHSRPARRQSAISGDLELSNRVAARGGSRFYRSTLRSDGR